jgi:hypothetical protein
MFKIHIDPSEPAQGNAESNPAKTYASPDLFRVESAKKLLQGSQMSGYYRDNYNQWYRSWS